MRYDDFEGSTYIVLQPDSVNNSYRFVFNAALTSTGKGSIPYDTLMTSASVSGYAEDGSDVSAIMIGSVALFASEEAVVVKLVYPGSAGRYKIKFLLTVSDSSVWEKDFNRIEALDL